MLALAARLKKDAILSVQEISAQVYLGKAKGITWGSVPESFVGRCGQRILGGRSGADWAWLIIRLRAPKAADAIGVRALRRILLG